MMQRNSFETKHKKILILQLCVNVPVQLICLLISATVNLFFLRFGTIKNHYHRFMAHFTTFWKDQNNPTPSEKLTIETLY